MALSRFFEREFELADLGHSQVLLYRSGEIPLEVINPTTAFWSREKINGA